MKTTNSAGFWESFTVPDGTYAGTWSGYKVHMMVCAHAVQFEVKEGLRGTSPVIVYVENGKAEVVLQE